MPVSSAGLIRESNRKIWVLPGRLVNVFDSEIEQSAPYKVVVA